MCDYSLQTIRSRPAKVGDKLTTRDFGTCTRGFAAAEDAAVAVCVLPGTELAFSNAVTLKDPRFFVGWKVERLDHATAIFRQVNKNEPFKHHDALEFPDGRIVLLTRLSEGQEASEAPTMFTCSQPASSLSGMRYIYIGTAQKLGVLWFPFLCAASVARCREAPGPKQVGALYRRGCQKVSL